MDLWKKHRPASAPSKARYPYAGARRGNAAAAEEEEEGEGEGEEGEEGTSVVDADGEVFDADELAEKVNILCILVSFSRVVIFLLCSRMSKCNVRARMRKIIFYIWGLCCCIFQPMIREFTLICCFFCSPPRRSWTRCWCRA